MWIDGNKSVRDVLCCVIKVFNGFEHRQVINSKNYSNKHWRQRSSLLTAAVVKYGISMDKHSNQQEE